MINDILQIIFIIIIYLIIRTIVFSLYYKQFIIDNWGDYKCKPYIMPIAGYFGFDTNKNYNECMFINTNKNSTYSLSPVLNVSNLMGDVLGDMGKSLNSMRGGLSEVRGFFGNILGNFTDKITNVITSLQVLFIKVRSLIGKLLGVFTTLIYTLLTTMATMTSMVNGPIGELAGLCFGPDTYIILENKELKKIKDIVVNDRIQQGGKVISIMKFKNMDTLYNIDGIFVSGTHLIYHNKKWKRVEDCNYSLLDKKLKPEFIYCLTTEHNLIYISNQQQSFLFRDFIETSNYDLNHYIKKTVLATLNNEKIQKNISFQLNEKKDYYTAGFLKNTPILLKNNIYKCISELKIGDITEKNGVIIAIIEHYNYSQIIYKLNQIYLSGDMIVFHNNKYKLIHSIPNIECFYSNEHLYHIITSTNKIEIDNILFCDYLESWDEKLNNFIDKTVDDYLYKN